MFLSASNKPTSIANKNVSGRLPTTTNVNVKIPPVMNPHPNPNLY